MLKHNLQLPSPSPAQPLPLDVLGPAEPLSAERQNRWIWAFLAIGVALRLVRYWLQFPLWEDEAMLSANYIARDYFGLLQPLDYHQVAPPLFLWGQLAVSKLLGFSEYSLRLIPFACSLAGLFLFRHVAGRLLAGTALVLAVGLYAVSYPMVRYTAEAKPYGCDLFLALVMFALAVEWLRRPDQSRWLWVLAAMIGPAVWYSFPAVFVGGALSLVVGYTLFARRAGFQPVAGSTACEPPPRGWLPWLLYNGILVGSFHRLIAVTQAAVGPVNEKVHLDYWVFTFPPITRPLKFLGWLVTTHTGGMLGYPAGGDNGASTLTFLCCVAGIALLVRRRQWPLIALCLLPLGLNFIAACLHRFPYGGHMRMSLYLGSVFCMLTSIGAAAALGWAARRSNRAAGFVVPASAGGATDDRPKAAPRPVHGLLTVLLSLLVLVATVSLFRDLTHPYKSGTTLRARDFARWFWFDLAHDGELMCLRSDTKDDLSPGTFDWGWSCLYVCNQRIYSPRHARGEPPDLARVSKDWPLRCVLYRSASQERDPQPLVRWLEDMQSHFRLVAHDKYPFPIYDKREHGPRETDFIEVFKFVPK